MDYFWGMCKSFVDFRISPNETNVLKGIAICAMLLHHLFFAQPSYGVVAHQLALVGKVCVSIFLFVSGYGLSVQYGKVLKPSSGAKQTVFTTLKFLAKRFFKFYLNYWIIFVIFVPLGVFLFDRPLQVAYGTGANVALCLFKDFWGLQDLESYNATWWFNYLILSLYLLFPFLFWIMQRKIMALGFFILLVLWPRDFMVQNFFYLFEVWNSNLVVFTLVFCFGIASALYADLLNNLLNKVNIWILTSSAFVATVGLCILRQILLVEFIDQILADAFISIFLALTVVCACRLFNREGRVLSFFGKHSSNMYLTHTFIVGYFFSDFIYGFKNPVLIFAVLLALTLLLSMVIEIVKNKLGFYKFSRRMLNFFRL